MRGLLRGGFPRLEQFANPFFELSNLRPDFPDKAVCFLDIPVQLAFLGGYALIKGANSNVSGFSLSIPLLTAIKRTLFRLNISIALPTWR